MHRQLNFLLAQQVMLSIEQWKDKVRVHRQEQDWVQTIPFGPSVVFTRSAIAIAPTKDA